MTGPAYGKLYLKSARVMIKQKDRTKRVPADVYIHIKGYALARVTHLDIEAAELEQLMPRSAFRRIKGLPGGLGIAIPGGSIEVVHTYIAQILAAGESTVAWVGVKAGGIYIGFKKAYIEKMEKVARERFKFTEF